ncbi:hypothetical protein [Halosolutus halophilus]|uniref:hypothetical protein n=1 Tax=Halosolutus halophilus TaxID=1552990 RepID=UPI002234F191|nr:hypothetical protein [Halosolutus halophilus]
MQHRLAGQRGRTLAALVLVVLLAGCLVWAGATPGDPTTSEYPDEVDVTPSPETYVGEQVVLGGFVVDTDPIVIATRASGYGRFTLAGANDHLQNADGPLERGDRVTAFGRLEDESTLVVERTTTREPSETYYMLGVSLVGGLWVASRWLRDWRFDRTTLAFAPRDESATPQDHPRGDGDGGERRA